MVERVPFKMLHDQILVLFEKKEGESSGGLYIPKAAQEDPIEGVVAAVGAGAMNSDGKLVPMSVKVGDKVICRKWGGSKVTYNGVEYSVFKESDIIAVMEEVN